MGLIFIFMFLFYFNVMCYVCYWIRINDLDYWLMEIKCEGVVLILELFVSIYIKIL